MNSVLSHRPTHLVGVLQSSPTETIVYTCRHVTPLRHIIIIQSQTYYPLTHSYNVLSREAAYAYFTVLVLPEDCTHNLPSSRRARLPLHHPCAVNYLYIEVFHIHIQIFFLNPQFSASPQYFVDTMPREDDFLLSWYPVNKLFHIIFYNQQVVFWLTG